MTIKNKVYNSLIAFGLAGAIGGIGSSAYYGATLDGKVPPQPPTVQRMHEIESKLEHITGKAMLENPHLNEEYTSLVGEYKTLESEPLAIQERKEYEEAVEVYSHNFCLFFYSYMLGMCSALPLLVVYLLKNPSKEKTKH